MVEQRLLTALNDLRLLVTQNRTLSTALMDLSQASLDYAKAAPPVDGPPKKELDAKLARRMHRHAELKGLADTRRFDTRTNTAPEGRVE